MPQTRNRYSYVLNNPLRYVDPTGHCTAGPTDNHPGLQAENAECDNYIDYLRGWGISIAAYGQWMSWQLKLAWNSVQRFAQSLFNDFSGETFRQVMGPLTFWRVTGDGSPPEQCGQRAFQCTRGDNTLVFTDLTFEAGEANWRNIQRTTVHELAHAWDNRGGNVLSALMATSVGGHRECPKCAYDPGPSPRPSDAAFDEREDWAEAVAWYVMRSEVGDPSSDHPLDGNYAGSSRWQYVSCTANTRALDSTAAANCASGRGER